MHMEQANTFICKDEETTCNNKIKKAKQKMINFHDVTRENIKVRIPN